MTDTLEDVDPPYRSGDSDKVERKPTWPSVEDATRRINVLIEGQTEGPAADMAARDLIVIMRELGRVTAEGERQYEENVSQIAKYAALEAENDRLKAPLTPSYTLDVLKEIAGRGDPYACHIRNVDVLELIAEIETHRRNNP